MRIRRLLFAVMCLFTATFMMAQQPFAPAWHPQQLKDFNPANPGLVDKDWKFNRSSVPYRNIRFIDQSIKANTQQFWDSQVAACLTWHMSCGVVPSQGATNFTGYNFNNWSYVDINVWWGGSAGEGIILPPSAPVTDASHLNGVKVIGQIFFPPTAFGGNPDWTNQMLETDGSGEYYMAKQLVEVARFYGFDGWFINEETKTAMGGSDNAKWEGFIKDFNKYKDSHMIIQVYTMSTAIAPIQNIWTLPGTSFFVNYYASGSAAANAAVATGQGVNHFDKFYYGLEIGGGGLSQGSNFRNLCGTTANLGSFDLFCPERQTWQPAADPVSGKTIDNIRDSEKGRGTVAYNAFAVASKNENRFWVNINNDVTDLTQYSGTSWPGMAPGVAERTSVSEKPFVTSFGFGNGKYRMYNGEIRNTQDWYHRGMQDVLPTFRWWVEGPKTTTGSGTSTRITYKLAPSFTYESDSVYNGGSAIQFKGTLDAGVDNIVRLYKTRLAVASGDQFELIYKASTANTIEVKLAFSENANAFTTIALPAGTSVSNGFSKATIDLTPYAGKTISLIAFNFKSATAVSNYKAVFGQLAVLPSGFAPACSNISNLNIENQLTSSAGRLRITWDKSTGDVHHYNVYLTQNSVRKLIGQTRNEGFYYADIVRSSPTEQTLGVEVIPVKTDLTELSSGASQNVNFPPVSCPEVQVRASKTLITSGESVTFYAKANNFPESYAWSFSGGGAQLVSKNAMGDTAVYKFTQDGIVDVTCSVTNMMCTAPHTETALIEVGNTVIDKVSCNKKVNSSSGAINTTEVEKYTIDCIAIPGSTSQKWCAGGLNEHWIIIDLQADHKLYKFVQYDGGVKEDTTWNLKNYRIMVSKDLVTWDTVVHQTGRPESIKTDWCKPTVARYVKYAPYNDDEKITIRIYEFEVYGYKGPMTTSAIGALSLDKGETKSASLTYDLSGAQRESNFSVTVKPISDTTNVTISNVNVDEGTKTITFNYTGAKYSMNPAVYEIIVKNGDWSAAAEASIQCTGNWGTNYFLNKTVWAPDPYNVGTYPMSTITDGNTSTSLYYRYASSSFNPTLQGANGQYFVIDMGTGNPNGYEIYKYQLYFAGTTYYVPGIIDIYTSNDNIDWGTLTKSNANSYNWTKVDSMILNISNANSVYLVDNPHLLKRFVRFDMRAPYTGSNTYISYFRPVEFQAFGVLRAATDLKDQEVSAAKIYPTLVEKGSPVYVNAGNAESEVTVIGIDGKQVFKLKGTGLITIPTSGLNKGVYIVNVESANGKENKKLVVK